MHEVIDLCSDPEDDVPVAKIQAAPIPDEPPNQHDTVVRAVIPERTEAPTPAPVVSPIDAAQQLLNESKRFSSSDVDKLARLLVQRDFLSREQFLTELRALTSTARQRYWRMLEDSNSRASVKCSSFCLATLLDYVEELL